jgi:hypothetical protein
VSGERIEVSDIKKIIDAMAALAAALPGSPHITIGLHASDECYRALLSIGAKSQNFVSDDGTDTWDAAQLYIEGGSINAYSAHRPIVATAPNPERVESALAQAQEALS